ncbi:MAG: response regulator [Lachnospiraceae bacterium]|nr:response regulator [Lachnospiraceae bacterium]
MFRILVADDEGIMRDSIRNAIESNFGSDCEVMTVRSGREVIEQCQTFRPDIAFVDIQMPGLSGIQAIQEVKKFDSSIVFIIISAYDRFSYAQEAVNLGVIEYVTKPVNKKKIIEVCVRAMHQVEEARKKRSDDLRVREKLEIVIPMIEDAFINNLVQEDRRGNVQDYLRMLDIRQQYCYMITLEFGEQAEDGVLTNIVGSNVRVNQIYTNMKEIIHDYLDCIAGPVMGSRIILYVPFDYEHLAYEQRVEIITRVRSMLRKLEQESSLKFRAGIGSVKDAEEAFISYRESMRCLRQEKNHVVHVMDLAAGQFQETYPSELEERYIQMGMKADAEEALLSASQLFDWMKENFELLENSDSRCPEQIEMKALELLLQLVGKAREAGTVHMDSLQTDHYLTAVRKGGSEQQVRMWFAAETRRICDEISNARKKDSGTIINRAIIYIKEHFAENIDLEDVSRNINISPYYFSRLFKQETGENFIEFLTYTRIQKAKEYLSNPDYSIKEVCSMCGYADPNYFSRIFRKYEGVSPSEYREK